MFSIHHLSVRVLGKTILDIPKLRIPQTAHTAIIGPNGAGKSTLLRALIGQYTQGEVRLFAQTLMPQLKQGKVAWLGQHGRYQLPLTVREYIMLGNRHEQLWWQESVLSSRENDLVHYFDLLPLIDKRIMSLSGGEQQRANIVRTLLQNAPVLLLDEPCNHLDIRHQHQLMRYLQQHKQEFSAVMVLHDLNLAAQYAQHFILMNQGQVVASGSRDEVLQTALLSGVYHWNIKRIEYEQGVYFQT